MHSAVIPLGLAFVCWIFVYWIYFRLQSSRRYSYPPGPPITNLILGNLSDVPVTRPWLTFTEWAKTYGSITHFRIFNQHVIVLNSIEDLIELIGKRTNIYSDRPQVPMVKLMGWDFTTAMKPYGSEWRIHRRLLQQSFRPAALLPYQPIQVKKVHAMLHGILNTGEDFMEHCRTIAGATVMSIVYDYDIEPKGDYFIRIVEEALKRISEAVLPGANIANVFPALRFIPSWVPGTGFKQFIDPTRVLTHQIQEAPMNSVKARLEAGITPRCMVTKLMERSANSLSEEDRQAIKAVAATCYTVSVLGTFFYAMTISPNVQKKAQLEIDSIVGCDRLVDYCDRNSLPYVEAIYREVLRWRPVNPLGVPHYTSEEDFYNGFYIPKGTIVITNIWKMSHNSSKYDKPETFNPDRFFDREGNLPKEHDLYAFGFGRRICPGRYFASSTVWLVIASVLQTFHIEQKKDVLGNDIPLEVQYSDGGISHPLPFECSITPRSAKTQELIMGAVSQ
ncbi:hypothetical protein GALMADRAFT_231148 [Galerina marginata CBS 339.88]|uniref:Cytochrome P450 n=1 Tax=Galerina marginata (strain CBS 339.88) TaxID=685588 RepID=A0A067SC94_GALM3|nr:hypothetical protein GALMADRAFT_231148 [Galerina marginata CBS 339.88]